MHIFASEPRKAPHALIKTATYSLMHLTVAIAVAYALTGNWAIALGIGLIEPFFQTIAYVLHERLWEKLGSGRSAPVSSVHACTPLLIGPCSRDDRNGEDALPHPA